MSEGRISSVSLRVTDLERSADFYRRFAGVPLAHSHEHPPENVVHCECMWEAPDGSFMFFVLYPAAASKATSGAEVGFSCANLDEIHELAQREGIPVVRPPHEVPWGREAQLRDPDGNLVTLNEPRPT